MAQAVSVLRRFVQWAGVALLVELAVCAAVLLVCGIVAWKVPVARPYVTVLGVAALVTLSHVWAVMPGYRAEMRRRVAKLTDKRTAACRAVWTDAVLVEMVEAERAAGTTDVTTEPAPALPATANAEATASAKAAECSKTADGSEAVGTAAPLTYTAPCRVRVVVAPPARSAVAGAPVSVCASGERALTVSPAPRAGVVRRVVRRVVPVAAAQPGEAPQDSEECAVPVRAAATAATTATAATAAGVSHEPFADEEERARPARAKASLRAPFATGAGEDDAVEEDAAAARV